MVENGISRGLRGRLAGLVALMLSVVASPAVAAGGEAEYRACIALAARDAAAARTRATHWAKAGGGTPAAACEATALFYQGAYAQAAQHFDSLANRSLPAVGRAALLGHAARAWLLAEDPERAIASSNRALALTPADPQLLVDRAEARAALADYAGAIEDLSVALAGDPGLVDAYALRASARRRIGAAEAARADLEMALALEPSHPEALLERGILFRVEGIDDRARADWQRVIAIAPASPAAAAARSNLARLDGDERDGR